MQKNFTKVTAWMLLIAFLLCGCQAAPAAPAAAAAPEANNAAPVSEAAEPIKIGWVNMDNANEYAMTMEAGFRKAEAELGDKIKLYAYDGKGDPLTQISAVEQLIVLGVDVICINPIEAVACTPAVEQANAAGIPVLEVNNRTQGGKFTYIGSDDYKGGVMQGEWAVENMPQGTKVCMLMAPMGMTAQVARRQGFLDVISEKRPDIELIAEQSGDGMRDRGMAITEDWLQTFPQIDMIVSHADAMALGAIQAIKDAGRLDQVTVFGFDGTVDGVQSIGDGDMTVTLFQNGVEQGYQAVYKSIDIANGVDGALDDKIIPFEVIDGSNWENYVK